MLKRLTKAVRADDLSGVEGGASPADAGPPFPTLGVTLGFLKAFVADKVAGKQSRYAVALENAAGQGPGWLSFSKGEILGIADATQAHLGYFVGYRRAGDWAERKKFATSAVQRLSGLSTDEVCENIIKPETSSASWSTEDTERSYAQMLLKSHPAHAGVGRATVFASHAWTFVFEELVAALEYFEGQQRASGALESFFWLDIFVVDENAAHTYPSTWWQTSFTEAVGAIGHTALVLSPWRSPVPLRRAWCLWEVYSTLKKEALLSVCMSGAETRDFHRVLAEDCGAVVSALCTIDAETAEAGSQSDLEMIFAAVRTLDGGFQTLNSVVLEQMRQWLLQNVERALQDGTGLTFVQTVDYSGLCEHCIDRQCGECLDLDAAEVKFGDWYRANPNTEDETSLCSKHWDALGRLRKRRFKAIQCVADLGSDLERFKDTSTEIIGTAIPGTAASSASLLLGQARLLGSLKSDGSFDRRHAASKKALEIRQELFGLRSLEAAEAMLICGELEDDPDDAYNFLILCLDIRMTMLYQNHLDLVETLLCLAKRLVIEGQPASHQLALPCLQKALEIAETHKSAGSDVASEHNINAVIAEVCVELGLTMSQLAENRMGGEHQEALQVCERATYMAELAYGSDHLKVVDFLTTLVQVIERVGSADGQHHCMLLMHLRRALTISRVRVGVDNISTAELEISLGTHLLDEDLRALLISLDAETTTLAPGHCMHIFSAVAPQKGTATGAGDERGESRAVTGSDLVRSADQQAEELLVHALAVLPPEGWMEEQHECVSLLLNLYERQGRKKDIKPLNRHKAFLESYIGTGDSSDDESSDEDSSVEECLSGGSGSSDSDASGDSINDVLQRLVQGAVGSLDSLGDELCADKLQAAILVLEEQLHDHGDGVDADHSSGGCDDDEEDQDGFRESLQRLINAIRELHTLAIRKDEVLSVISRRPIVEATTSAVLSPRTLVLNTEPTAAETGWCEGIPPIAQKNEPAQAAAPSQLCGPISAGVAGESSESATRAGN